MPPSVKCLTFMITEEEQIGSKAFCLSGKACALLKTAQASRFASWLPGEQGELRELHELLRHPWDRPHPLPWEIRPIPSCLSFLPWEVDFPTHLQALQDAYHTGSRHSPREPGFHLIWGSEEPL